MTATAAGVKTFRSPRIQIAANQPEVDTKMGDLNGNMSVGATTLVLASAASATVAVGDYLVIDTEVMEVTAAATQLSFTVVRGALSTTAATHTAAADVNRRRFDVPDVYVDLSPWTKNVSWPISNEGGDATGAGTEYMETVPGEKPKEGPLSWEFMKSFTAGKVDETMEPLARSGAEFWLKVRNDDEAASATNPEWTGQVHSLDGYMPVTGDVARTDAATVPVTAQITASMERNPAL